MVCLRDAMVAELAITTNFSFLRGASHPEEMVARAAELGLTGIGIADVNTLAGVVRAHVALRETAAKDSGLKIAIGTRLAFVDGTPDILAFPSDRVAYGRLSRLLTLGKRRAKKGACTLSLEDLIASSEGLNLIVMPPRRLTRTVENQLGILLTTLPHARLWLGATLLYDGHDRQRLARLRALSEAHGIPGLATLEPLYHAPERRPLQDILTCIRTHKTIHTIGRALEAHAERHLKEPQEMRRLFRYWPESVDQTLHFFGQCQFSLDELRYEYPDDPVPHGKTPQAHLEELTWIGASARYPMGIPEKVRDTIDKELALIAELDYARYFLTVNDIVAYARSRGILCQGRGSAANSVVCFCLGITAVDPTEVDLLFERFVSAERREPPDIDVDFEHERREEVIQWIYERYGRDRAGIAATVISYRPRSAMREVGKALGLSEDVTTALANTVWGSWGSAPAENHIREAGLDPDNPEIARAIHWAEELLSFPRHLSQHVGGFVLTRGRLDEVVPVGNAAMDDRTFIEWDKDDIDALGIMKIDVLALGMLTCIRKCFNLIAQHGGLKYSLATLPREDKAVYAMLQKADSIGVFQVESRAQMNMLPRLKPEKFYDLVIEVAIVRPGPIQGDMVHPYLRRRQGREAVSFPSPAPPHNPHELRDVLGKTLGVPLFQEQAMKLAIVAANFTPSEANHLRRAMATFRNLGTINAFRDKLVTGMVTRGYEEAFAARCFKQIEGFGSYGFPESHAIAFARLVWVSAWIKHHEPAIFAAALLNSQPMGFYAPAQIVRDARDHGVQVDPVDVNRSGWDNQAFVGADGQTALRLGLRQITGFRADWAEAIVAHRPYASLEELTRKAGLPPRAVRLLADADACRSLARDRREALWDARRMPAEALPLFAAADARELGEEADMALPDMALQEHVVADYQTLRLSLKAHPMALLRPVFQAEKILPCANLATAPAGKRVSVAGLVLVRQRPGNGKAIFITLEDETGVANIILWARTFEAQRRAVMSARLMQVQGEVQRSPEGIVHLLAHRIIERNDAIARLSDQRNLSPPLGRGDEVARPPHPRMGHPRQVRILPKSRDFH